MTEYTSNIIFAGGGTGGHVYPALASIESLQSRGNYQILYIGGYHGIENKIVHKEKIVFKKIWISGFQRYLTLQNFLFPLKLIVSLIQSMVTIIKFKPNVVVGTGGYVSGPVIYSAAKLGVPTLIQEQDYYPGITTRILAKYADVVCIPDPDVKKYLPRVKGKVVVTGNPVRMSLKLIDRNEAAICFGLDPQRPIIFIFGGSQGAQSINKAISNIGNALIERYKVQFIWQTGERNYNEISTLELTTRDDVVIRDYISEMGKAYSAADIIVSRAGAITLAELSKVMKGCVLIPYPHAAANHQEKNARAIVDAGAAVMVLEDENFEVNLQNSIEKLLTNRNLAQEMGKNWQKIYQQDATVSITDEIIGLMGKK